MFEVRDIALGTEDAANAERLLAEAFPPEERLEFASLVACAQTAGAKFQAYYEDGRFVGFIFLALWEDLANLIYLAVSPQLRGRGCGSRILADIGARFPDKTVVLEIEPVVEGAPNYEECRTRKAFYMRNGYEPSGWGMVYEGIVFEVLSKGPGFVKERVEVLVNCLPYEWVKTLVPWSEAALQS